MAENELRNTEKPLPLKNVWTLDRQLRLSMPFLRAASIHTSAPEGGCMASMLHDEKRSF